jgi:hypothetical protein
MPVMRPPRLTHSAAPFKGPGMTLVATAHRPLLPILLALSGAHFLNDLISSMIPATYPLLKEAYRLDFVQVGLITLAFQLTASLLQPLLGRSPTTGRGPTRWSPGWRQACRGCSGLPSRSTTRWCWSRRP